MSSQGLNASIYRVTKKYAELLDTYLVEKKTKLADPALEKKIVEFLDQLTREDLVDPQIQLIGAILERDYRERKSDSRRLIRTALQGLQGGTINESVIRELERIASALSSESSMVLSRIQGQTR